MLRYFGPSTWAALVLGGLLAVVAFVPVAIVRYRKTGRLRPLDIAVLVLVAVYAMALWTYTLVPIPETDNFRCRAANLKPFSFIDAIRRYRDGGRLLRNSALLHAVLNIMLFIPLGFFLRVLLKRGIVAAGLIGFGVSLAIELTQKTGIWGWLPCAHRTFEIDDLILNTTGAVLGSLGALPVALLLIRRLPEAPLTEVTLGRRLIGMATDLIAIAAIGWPLVIGWRVIMLYLLGWTDDDLPAWVDGFLGLGVPGLVQGYWVLVNGRTLGEAAVQLEPVAAPGAELRSRLLKFLGGIGGFLFLSGGLTTWPLAILAFGLATIILVAQSRDHRGLSHTIAGMELRVERPGTAGAPPTLE